MDTFDYKKYIYNNVLLQENDKNEFEGELKDLGNELAAAIEAELETKENPVNEAVGIVGIIGWVLLSNTVANMVSKFAKKQFAQREWGAGEEAAKKIYDFTHKNEDAFKAPIKRAVGIFTKNEKYRKLITDILYAIVIFAMAGQAGSGAVSYLKKAGYLKGGIYALKSLIKGKEVHNLLKGVVEDMLS